MFERRSHGADSVTDKPDSPDSDAAGAEVLAPETAGSSGKRSIEQQFQAMITSVQRGPAPNPIAKHITPDHIDRAFDITEKGMDAMERDRSESRNYWKFMAMLIVAASLVLVGLLVVQRERRIGFGDLACLRRSGRRLRWGLRLRKESKLTRTGLTAYFPCCNASTNGTAISSST